MEKKQANLKKIEPLLPHREDRDAGNRSLRVGATRILNPVDVKDSPVLDIG